MKKSNKLLAVLLSACLLNTYALGTVMTSADETIPAAADTAVQTEETDGSVETSDAEEEREPFAGEITPSYTELLTWKKIDGAESYTISVKVSDRFIKLVTVDADNIDIAHGENGKYYVSDESGYNAYTLRGEKFVKTGTASVDEVSAMAKANNTSDTFLLTYTKDGRISAQDDSFIVSLSTYYKPAVSASANTGSITLKWKAVPGAEKYRVCSIENGKLRRIKETTSCTASIATSGAAKEYILAVRAYADGKWTKVTKADTVKITSVASEAKSGSEMLSLWTDSARTKKELTAYMAAITDETSPDYIPVESRIAVFDFDGTLFCETDPNYFDYMLLHYRVLEDPDYKDKASDFEREVANKIKEQNETGASFSGLETDHGKAVASAFKGMTLEQFSEYIQNFKKQAMPNYDGMLRGEGFYKPMLQVIDYLKANDFTVYIISGTDRLIVRGIFKDSVVDLPNSQIIGSDELLVASGQNGEDGLKYQYTHSDELILGGEFMIKNLKMNKVTVIAKEIGEQPVLSFGNSTGDTSMANYTITNNKYKSLAFMLCCDDTQRENGKLDKAENMYALCEENGWIAVSMKNDWTTVYGDGVTYKNPAEKSKEAA